MTKQKIKKIQSKQLNIDLTLLEWKIQNSKSLFSEFHDCYAIEVLNDFINKLDTIKSSMEHFCKLKKQQ